jgi:hypothetical protein
MLKFCAFVVGTVLLFASAHLNIIAAPAGYGADHVPLLLGIVAATALASIVMGRLFSERRFILGALTLVCLLAGESYNLMMIAERIVSARDTVQTAAGAVSDVRAASVTRVAAADTAKTAADAAVAANASAKDCRENCRLLLQGTVTAAKLELDQARSALAAIKPSHGSGTALADRLGLAPWVVDLIAAGLAALAANGLACCLIAYSGHRRPSRLIDHAPMKTVVPTYVLDDRDHGRAFFSEVLQLRPRGRVDVQTVEAAYLAWCNRRGLSPLPAAEIGAQVATACRAAGVKANHINGTPKLIGVVLAPQPLQLSA